MWATVEGGGPVRIRSGTLGKVVYWVRDQKAADELKCQGGTDVCYTLAELRQIQGKTPELLRGIHRYKRQYGAILEKVLEGGYTFKAPGNTVQCGDCRHFERADHPHMGRCAKGHGRYWLWDSDERQCEDFEAVAAGEGRP